MSKSQNYNLGYFEPRGPGKILIRWRSNGQQVGKTIEGDYPKALRFLADQLDPPTTQPQVSGHTFASYIEKEWAQRARDKWKLSTQETHGAYVNKHITPFFGDMPLAKIAPTDVAAFYAKLEAAGLSARTRRTIHAVLTAIFAYAVELKLRADNPVTKGLSPKVEDTEKPALSAKQLDELLQRVNIAYKAFYMVLALTAVRMGEALGLKWQDIDFADSQLHIRRAIYRNRETSPKTKTSLRSRPMTTALRQALLNHKAMAVYLRPTDYVFASSTGKHPLNPDMLREHLQETLRGMGIHLGPRADGLHLLRHSSGSLLYQATGDVKATQSWLGHSNANVTLNTYTHLAPGHEERSASKVEQAIFASPSLKTDAQA